MKKYLLLLLILLELSLVKIPPYIELNNLAIIEEIAVEHINDQYTVIFKEIIPTKADQGIEYEYKHYIATAKSLDKAYSLLKNQTKKTLYLNKTKHLITNSIYSKEILYSFDITPSNITHTKDIYKEINYSKDQS